MIMDADHSSICKFKSRLGTYTTISNALSEVFNEVAPSRVRPPLAGPERRVSTHDRTDPIAQS